MEEEIFPDKPSRFEVATGFVRRQFHHGRGGRAKLAISTGFGVRLVTTAISFIILPITVRYLGNEGYGLMTTITAVVGWLQFTSMGIGLGLQNALTEETAKHNIQAQKELVSTAAFSLFAIGLLLLIIGLLAFPSVPWQRVFPPVTSRFTAEIPWAVLVVFLGFVSTVVLSFVSPIYSARQELHISNIQVLITSVLTLLGTFIAVDNRWGLLGVVSCTIGLTAVIQWSFALWTLYGRGIPEIRPELSSITRAAGSRIYKTGFGFLILQICNIAFFQLDAFLIMRFLTVDQVTPYSVAQRVFLQTGGLFAVATGALWSAYGNAQGQGDLDWIRRTHRKMVHIFLLFFGGLSIFMVLLGHWALTLWVGKAAAPGTALIAGVAVYFCVREWNSLHAMLLNGLNVIRPQVWNSVLTAALILALNLILVRQMGPLGLALGGALGSLLGAAWYFPYLARKALTVAKTPRLDLQT